MATVRRFVKDPDLFGPRGTGKSNWIRTVYSDALPIDLLAPELERRYAARPERLREQVAGHPDAGVVDEVQKVPASLDVVHQLIEAGPGSRFVLTGSSARKLKRAGVDLLAGRAVLTSEVARECEVSRKTVEGYIEILEDLLLSFRVPVFTRRARRHLTAHPKFYWFDAGAYRSVRPDGPLDRPEEIAGAALEGLVAQHLRAWIDYTDPRLSLSFWRTKSGSEIDFVVYGPERFWAIEVKHAATVRAKDLRALKTFNEDYPDAELRLLYRGSERLEIDGVSCFPCGHFLENVVPGADLP